MAPLPGVLGRLYPGGRVEEPPVEFADAATQNDAPPPFFERQEIRLWTGHNEGTSLPTLDHDTNVIKLESPETHRCAGGRGRQRGYEQKYISSPDP